jgi:hypothetical protein
MQIHADPEKYADAGPVVGGGPEQPWGWTVEYDIEVPVKGDYTFQIRYAAAEARPVEVLLDGKAILARCCMGVTFSSTPSQQSAGLTWNSSGARWESMRHYGRITKRALTKGRHTLKLTRKGPMPHLVAIRLDTAEEFPADWKAPVYKVRDLDRIPAKFRGAFSKVASLPPRIDDTSKHKVAGSLTINAWTFDRGNALIFASPDEYADGQPLAGGGPLQGKGATVEYDVDFPVAGEYSLQFRYASAKARPVDVWLDNRRVGVACSEVTIDTRPTEYPVRFSSSSRVLTWETLYDHKTGKLLKLPVTRGKHTLKLTRTGPLPNLSAVRLSTEAAFPKDWRQPERKTDLSRVPPRFRSIFLPPGAVNTAALRQAIKDTMATHGQRYPDGKQYVKQLDELEARSKTDANGSPEQLQEIHDALTAIRRRAMLNHPALRLDCKKLLFLQRSAGGYGHTYSDQQSGGAGGNLCVLSPVGPEGKVTRLVKELDGGLFDRFDLSFDGKKVVFGYKKNGGAFRIYEIDIDPKAGKMVPGSLRQLTFGCPNEAEALKYNAAQGRKADRGFNDMDPCYMPDGRIVFVSTRSMRNVFCAGSTVTTLYIMDANGKNIRCLSAGPINELSPSVLDDGRVLYTRWEYVDKGLGNGAGLWTVRPDGSGSDHVYKNNTVWPAGMANARGIPDSPKIVTIGGGHHFTAVGTVVVVDARRSRRTTEAMNCITPETGYPPSMGPPTSKFGAFMDPYPFSEKFFLVSHKLHYRSRSGHFGIYALDAWGNRAEIYCSADIDSFEPMPLRPRPKPRNIAPIGPENNLASHGLATTNGKKTASLFIQNIYQGMTGIERGRVKYVRVMGALEWPWRERGMSNVGVDVHRKKVYGIVKVHEDGSARFKVPAEENLFFQALDKDYMALQQMPTFVNLMPGENRSCIGCHEKRRNAPSIAGARPEAVKHPVQTLTPQPGDTGPRMVHYPADVQPILDKHCVGCHSGDTPKGRLDLTPDRSYKNLINSRLVNYRACGYGAAHFRAVPPLTHGSLLSQLTAQIRKDPCKAKLTRAEFIKIVTWIDANVPFHGFYGKIIVKAKDHPDSRKPSLVAGK